MPQLPSGRARLARLPGRRCARGSAGLASSRSPGVARDSRATADLRRGASPISTCAGRPAPRARSRQRPRGGGSRRRSFAQSVAGGVPPAVRDYRTTSSSSEMFDSSIHWYQNGSPVRRTRPHTLDKPRSFTDAARRLRTGQYACMDGDDASSDPVLLSVAAYSGVADEYEATHASKMADRAERFAKSLPAHSSILDAGCGPGRDLARFVKHGHHPQGVDLNPVFVAMASRAAPTVQCDLRSIGDEFAESTFDGIWAAASLVHLVQPELVDVLAQFARLLRPAGQLYLCVKANGATGWLDEPDGRRWYTVWDSDDLVDRVTAAGFVVSDVERDAFVEVWASRA
jgi:SAM-dependent methyltransferase